MATLILLHKTYATMNAPTKNQRKFLPKDFEIKAWEQIQTFYENLSHRAIFNIPSLKQWLADRSELESALAEEMAWRYIRMTCYTAEVAYQEDFQFFVEQIQPHITQYSHRLNQKLLQCPLLEELTEEEGYKIMIRSLHKQAEIFREENIPLQTSLQSKEQKYGEISGAMSIVWQGTEITLPQANNLLLEADRAVRQGAFEAMQARRLQEADGLQALFDELLALRHQIARNAGFDNFRDYMFAALGRFDYSPQHCFDFHEAVAQQVVPILNERMQLRKTQMALPELRPWDKQCDPLQQPALVPFRSSEELVEKTIACLQRIDPYFAECLSTMQAQGHLDLESRKNKAPGGYNYPLAESDIPFIFMNATSNLRDLTTLLHESGHAVHAFLSKDLPLQAFKDPTAEVAELASMAMELLTMEAWDVFFDKAEDLRRAKIEHLEEILETLPWVATIDKFQHWLYEHPQHSTQERNEAWLRIFEEFADSITDWTGLERIKAHLWQKQLHLFEVPFYYIEYGFAQLGAIAIWRNYRQNPQKTLAQYKAALSLGYTRSIPEIYQAAGIEFRFSADYIAELMDFVKA